MAKTKMSQASKAAAKMAAEVTAALEFQAGYDRGLAGEPNLNDSIVYDAGYRAGHNEKVQRIKEAAKKKKKISRRLKDLTT